MGPTMFREQLRRIFCLRLTRAEVAGLVTAFNLHREGMVDAKEFARRCCCSASKRKFSTQKPLIVYI